VYWGSTPHYTSERETNYGLYINWLFDNLSWPKESDFQIVHGDNKESEILKATPRRESGLASERGRVSGNDVLASIQVAQHLSVFIYLFIYDFWDRILLCHSGWPQARYVAHTGLELVLFLLQPLAWWSYRQVITTMLSHLSVLYYGLPCKVSLNKSFHNLDQL
jgi:hypothetical protein